MATGSITGWQRLAPLAQLFWANPVVVRDLRVRLRGARSFWSQAAYLFLLGAIVLVGYAQAGSGHGGDVSAVDVQAQLQEFYYYVFLAIAALMCLIAPALTAASVTTERQRLSMDLLVTTPLTSAQLLTGKILSSVAFLLLLLALSVPASALCIILGGATLADVFRIYVLLAIDSLVLASIGIVFSCAVRASLPALAWTYLAVIAFEIVSAFAFVVVEQTRMAGMGGGLGAPTDLTPASALFVLNPFVAVFVGSGKVALFGLSVPVWLCAAVVCPLVIRLLLTTAACRLGLYGSGAFGSLRRQILFLTALLGTVLFWSVASAVGSLAGSATGGHADLLGLVGFLIGAFVMPGVLLFPSLFVPARGDDLPPGARTTGWYDIRRAFRPEHAGSLPFFHIWLATLLASAAVGYWIAGEMHRELFGMLLLTGLYLSGIGFLYWSLARLAGSVVSQLAGARGLAFGLFVVIAAIPPMAIGLIGQDLTNSSLTVAWIFSPLAALANSAPTDVSGLLDWDWSLLCAAMLTYGLGAVANGLAWMASRGREKEAGSDGADLAQA